MVYSAYQILGKQHLNKKIWEKKMACKNGLQHSHLSDTQLTAKNSTLKICGNHFQTKQLSKLLQANDHDNGYFHFDKFHWNWTQTQNHLVHKQTLSHLAKWSSVHLQTKWFWVRVQLQSLNPQIPRLRRARSFLTFRQL